jgi:hypothetical protein
MSGSGKFSCALELSSVKSNSLIIETIAPDYRSHLRMINQAMRPLLFHRSSYAGFVVSYGTEEHVKLITMHRMPGEKEN